MQSKLLKNPYYRNNLIRFLVLFYWTVYWLFNSIDKFIGGSHFLWVGKDRFAQFQRYFDSAGWADAGVTNFALILVGALEIFAFLFFAGALWSLWNKDESRARSWFIWGIGLTLATFTLFSIGDQIFGDRFELLEHSLFWMVTLFSWVIYAKADEMIEWQKEGLDEKQQIGAAAVLVILILVLNVSIFGHKQTAYKERRAGVEATLEGDNLYKCTFPFLAGSTAFEKSLGMFMEAHPDKKIKLVYTVPNKLRKQKADALIVYIQTQNK